MNQKRKLVSKPVGAVDKRRRPRGLTRAIRTAIDAIIFDRCTRADACKRAEISERALYLALEKAEVAAYWRKQTDVFRSGERAANLHALVRIRDADKNANASVKAVQVLEQLESEAVGRPAGGAVVPGFVICIVTPAQPAPQPPIDVTPMRRSIPPPQR